MHARCFDLLGFMRQVGVLLRKVKSSRFQEK